MRLRDDIYLVRSTAYADGQPLCDLSFPSDEENVVALGAPVFGFCGLVGRPLGPDDEGSCEAVVADIGGTNVVLATRDLRAYKITGELEEGETALVSIPGKCCVIVKNDGTVSIRQNGDDGSTDAFLQIEPDGAILIRNQWGGIEIGPNGVIINAGDDVINLGGGTVQTTSTNIALAGGSVGLGPAPAIPMTFAPTSGVAVPAKSVFFTP